MSKRITIWLFVLVAGLSTGVSAAGTSERFSASFSTGSLRAEPRYLNETPYANQPFQFFTMDGLDVTRDLGEPCLPVKVMHIYVPRGKQISQIVVESQTAAALPGEYLVLPGQREIPLSSTATPEQVPPDQATYASAAPYPSSPVVLASTGTMGGRRIASIKVFPLQYSPSARQLTFNEEVDFRVELADAPEAAVPRETPEVARLRNSIVEKLAENGSEVENDFPGTGTLDAANAVEYLLICHENHVDEYAPLRDWKTRKGVPAAIKTWQEITATYPGRDNAEKIKNCIKDYYLNHSTVWVAIGGSAGRALSYIRGCYCDVEGTLDTGIPCDLYFEDMDSDWNQNNNSYWGETTDGVDLYPDVYVGRLTGSTGIQCASIVQKIRVYEGCYQLPTDYQLHTLFMAELLDGETDGAINKNMIDNESVPGRFDPIQKLFESSGNENHTTVINALNSGKGIVNHDGHGNVTIISIGPDVLTSDDMASLTNAPRYTLFYTLACDPAAFDNVMGCLGKSFCEDPNGGGFFVGNSRYGWYWPGESGYGTGDLYDREFFKSIFVRGYCNLGVIHADAKIQRIPYSGDDETDRWTQFSLNLLGDPETPVWLDTPKTMLVSHAPQIPTGSHTFVITATSGGSPLGQARVCLWMGSDIYLVGETLGDGTATFTVSPAEAGSMLVTVAKNGYLPFMDSVRVNDASAGVGPADGTHGLELAVTPNPGVGPMAISFSLPSGAAPDAKPEIAIYDAAGRLVVNLPAAAGSPGRVTWNGKTADGARVPPGIYFLKIACGGSSLSTKLVLLK